MASQALINALAAVDAEVGNKEEFALVGAKIRGLLIGYDARWGSQTYEIHGVENTLTSPLYNPETGKPSRSYLLAGKLDVTMTDDMMRRVLMDHKTCSEDIEDPNAAYWRQLMIEAQPTTYMLLSHLNGERIDYAIWDVVRKPGIAPKQLTKADNASISKHGTYFDFPAQPCEKETLAMYTARLAHDCTVERPTRYFQRRQVARLDQQLFDQAAEIWEHSQTLLEERRRDRHVRNSDVCMNYGRPCTFLGICSGYDEPTSEKWRKKKLKHAELPPEVQADSDLQLITVSRLKSFTCRARHFFEYELGIERVDAEERETLWFGTAWHAGLEAWFKTKRKEQQNDNSNTVKAIGVESDAVAC